MLARFQALAHVFVDAPEVAAVAGDFLQLTRSIDIMLGFLLHVEIAHAVHVETAVNVTNCMTKLCETSAASKNLVARHHQGLLEYAGQSSLIALDESSGLLQADVDSVLKDTNKASKKLKSVPSGGLTAAVKLIAARFQNTLALFQLSEHTSQTRLVILTRVLSVILDTITVDHIKFLQDFSDAMKAAFKACPAFHSMNDGSGIECMGLTSTATAAAADSAEKRLVYYNSHTCVRKKSAEDSAKERRLRNAMRQRE